MPPHDVLRIESLTVKPDRIVCEVQVPNAEKHYTTPALIEALRQEFPNLPLHTCKNSSGKTFAAVMNKTSLPHLFEHLVIDLQTQASIQDERVFIGTTEWLDEAAGKARIEVSFADDLNALRAFRDAAQILNRAMV